MTKCPMIEGSRNVEPLIANTNSASPVALVVFSGFAVASCKHAAPDIFQARSCHAVSCSGFGNQTARCTAAALYLAPPEASTILDGKSAAITNTQPPRPWRSAETPHHCQQAVFLVGHIYCGHRHWQPPIAPRSGDWDLSLAPNPSWPPLRPWLPGQGREL